jgi:plastocyanin
MLSRRLLHRACKRTLTALAIVSAAAAASADVLTGRIDAQVKPGNQRGTVIVFAEPLDAAAPVRPAKAALTQQDKSFRPPVLAVPVGSIVDFPNSDPIFHNVFSLSPPEPFDLGLYRAGSSKSRTFAKPGYYWVFCNIHPQMAAFLAVVPTPWVTQADVQGQFRLDVPQGRYRLTAVSERAAPVSVELNVGGATYAPSLQLDERAFVMAAHKNKFGQPYPASAYDPSRRKP